MTTIDSELLPEPLPPERRGWRTGDLAKAAVVALAVWFGLQMLWSVSSLVFLVFLATLFGLAVARGVDFAERYKIRRGIASAIIVFGTLGIIGGGLALTAPTLVESGRELQTQFPAALTKLQGWIDSKGTGVWGSIIKQASKPSPSPAITTVTTPEGGTAIILGPANGATSAAGPVPPATRGSANQARVAGAQQAATGTPATTSTPLSAAPPRTGVTPSNAPRVGADGTAQPLASEQLKQRLLTQLSKVSGYLFSAVSSTVSIVAALFLLIFLAIYVGAEPDVYRGWLLATIPATARPQMRIVLTEISTVLRKWLVTQLIAMVAIGTVSTVVLLVLRVKAPYALGFIAGLLEFIPTVGPIMSAVPAIIMGFVDSPEKALYVGLAYWGIQFIENNLLIPSLMRGGMDLPPAITLVAQTLMTLLFGFVGLMVAVPLTAAVLVPLRMVAERENARERAIVKFTKLQADNAEPPVPPKAATNITVGRADRGPQRPPSSDQRVGVKEEQQLRSEGKDPDKEVEKDVETDAMVAAGTRPTE